MDGTLLVIDDDPASRRLVTAIFAAEGMRVIGASDGPEGVSRARDDAPDVVLLDMRLPTMDGFGVLEAIGRVPGAAPVVMVTADLDLKSAIRATRLGAYDYLTKPIDQDELVATVRRALETRRLRAEVEELRRRTSTDGGLAEQMGSSPQASDVIEQVRTVAATGFTVLVVGETGTGKELVAQAIHRASGRRGGAFVALDCGAIPEALLESELFGHERGAFTGADRSRRGTFALAEGGTLFLDEIGNLPAGLQAKLLRVLESRVVTPLGGGQGTAMDLRFVAATNEDLRDRVAAGQFRSDLYFRLAEYTVSLPPLRERVVDVAHLATRFVEQTSVELRRPAFGFAPEALALLERHPWPGNVRELRNVVRQAVLGATGLVIRREDVAPLLVASKRAPSRGAAPALGAPGGTLREIASRAAREAEREAIAAALRASNGNKSRAARALSTDYKTLHLKMKSFGLRGRDFER